MKNSIKNQIRTVLDEEIEGVIDQEPQDYKEALLLYRELIIKKLNL